MDDLAVSDINPHMARIAHNITWLSVRVIHRRACGTLLGRTSW